MWQNPAQALDAPEAAVETAAAIAEQADSHLTLVRVDWSRRPKTPALAVTGAVGALAGSERDADQLGEGAGLPAWQSVAEDESPLVVSPESSQKNAPPSD